MNKTLEILVAVGWLIVGLMIGFSLGDILSGYQTKQVSESRTERDAAINRAKEQVARDLKDENSRLNRMVNGLASDLAQTLTVTDLLRGDVERFKEYTPEQQSLVVARLEKDVRSNDPWARVYAIKCLCLINRPMLLPWGATCQGLYKWDGQGKWVERKP